jgi:hypothetical protein
MFHPILSDNAGHAFALLASLRAGSPPDRVAAQLVDALDTAAKDTRHYQAAEPSQHPRTWAAALLIAVDELPEPQRQHVLANTQVYVDAWRPLAQLHVSPAPTVTEPAAPAAPAPQTAALIDAADVLLGGSPAKTVATQDAPGTLMGGETIAATTTEPLRLTSSSSDLTAERLPVIDVETPVGRAKRSPFSVEADPVAFKGRRPKWLDDLLVQAPLLLVTQPNELIGNGSRGPARAASALALVRLVRSVLFDVPGDLTVEEVNAWLDAWDAAAIESPLGPAIDNFAQALFAAIPKPE